METPKDDDPCAEAPKDKYGKGKEGKNSTASGAQIGGAFFIFGQGAHTIMDNVSPAHRDFQVYDTQKYTDLGTVVPLVAGGLFAADMLGHSEEEERKPTTEEMNEMVDVLRLRFQRAFGDELYNQAVPEDQRRETEQRRRGGR